MSKEHSKEIVEDECGFEVRYIGAKDLVAFERDKIYTVLSIEKGWYRIMTELDEDYLFPPHVFERVSV